ncbi:hypothetical protein BS78_05G243800 [Paspalum vaginatum]|nr:hypothetical protein BS78_05G243800 [Paspalum vaginatum]
MATGLNTSLLILLIYASLLAYQAQGGRFHPFNPEIWNGSQSQPLPSEDARAHIPYYAVHKTYDGSYFGMVATMDVYAHSFSDGQATATAIWIASDHNSDVESIAVGWEVSPSLSSFPSRDSYRRTWCHNMKCPGFQPVSGSQITPGAAIKPVSDVNGSRQKITVKILKDPSTGDWWIHYGFNSPPKPVGFYPAKLFESLNKNAARIAIGGGVDVLTSHTRTLPPMGSGYFPSDKAATLSDISLIEKDGRTTPINVGTTRIETKSSCYSATPIQGAMFSYGGPGGCSA